MLLINSFLFAGFVCAICQIILDNTKLTAGHITTLMTILGSFLSLLGIYDKIISVVGSGACVIISNFGYLLYSSGLNGYNENGILGLFQRLLCSSSVSLVSVIVLSFVFALIFKAKD